ncbi:aldolase/citrate lyase family protein [Actinomadura alba]
MRDHIRVNLSVSSTDDLSKRVLDTSAEHERHFPASSPGRQPVHTVYVPADRFGPSTPKDFGTEALRLVNNHTPGVGSFGAAFGIQPDVAGTVRERVTAKLAAEPIEDLRIDFEDGYGVRPDTEEDSHVDQIVEAVAAAYELKALPHFWGLRVKSFTDGGHERSMRTLDGFLTSLRDRLGRLPGGFVITFPKVVMPEQVVIFVDYLTRLESALGLPVGVLQFEVQIETTEAIINHRGELGLRPILEAAGGRLTGAHFGVFDYTAAVGLPPDEQRLDHPACDFARHIMQVSLAGTGVRLSDGSTNAVPRSDSAEHVSGTWATHAAHVRHSLRHGFYQGWDLHPAHLASRYAVVYGFHLTGIEDDLARVKAWREQSQQQGAVLDEPATIRALTARLQRAVDCGALEASAVS